MMGTENIHSNLTSILIVDDNIFDTQVLSEMLKDYTLIIKYSAKEALEYLKENSVNLILLDIVMPEMDGIALAQEIRKNPLLETIPILFITAKSDGESIKKCFQAGATDYIVKPYSYEELHARVTINLETHIKLQSLEEDALLDYLTGICNRRSFFKKASTVINDFYNSIYVILIDIDSLKEINDTYGHFMGDMVIKAFSTTASNALEKDMLLARYGGDEFVILAKDYTESYIVEWIDKIRKTIEKTKILTQDNKTIYMTISVGIAKKEKLDSINDLLNRADGNLYISKSNGSNQVTF